MVQETAPQALSDLLLDDARRPQVVSEIVELIESQVAARRGLAGAGMKTALAMAKKARPDMLTVVVERVLPEFCETLQPYYTEFLESGESDFVGYVESRRDEIGQQMLAVIDARTERSQNQSVKSMYKRLRGSAGDELVNIAPKLASLVERYRH